MPPATRSARPAHRCTECGLTLAKWVGRCPECQAWGSVTEAAPAQAPAPGLRTTGSAPLRAARPVREVSAEGLRRLSTGLPEVDRVLGGGLVAGQVVLLAGEPGVGKSTLLGMVGHAFALLEPRRPVLYVSGEESVEQMAVRAQRIGATAPGLLVADDTDVSAVVGHVEQHDPALLVVDSVQAMASPALEGRPGGVAQVQEVAGVLTRLAKSRGLPLLLVGQSTRENAVAGPRALEHVVDTVLTFEGDKQTSLRLLRAVKNRYGPAEEVVCFEQTEKGLREVPDPSDLFRSTREVPVPGTALAITVDGRRALPAEVQALLGLAKTPQPRRSVTGLDSNRVAMLLAVTEQSAGVAFDRDVFVATVGGARLSDPAVDLAVCVALFTALHDIAMPAHVACVGEVALSGDLRPVPMIGQRVAEAARLGYRQVLVPPGSLARLEGSFPGVAITEMPHLRVALARLAQIAQGRPAERAPLRPVE